MPKKLFQLSVIILFISILIGCTDDPDQKSKESTQAETQQTDTAGSENKEGSAKQEKSGNSSEASADYKQNIGDMNVWIGGEVVVDADKVVVNGKSNIHPGSIISTNGVSTLPIADFNDDAEIQENGSFHFEYPGYEGNATVTFKLSPSLGEGEEYYGEGFKNATGPQVFRTSDIDRWEVKATINLDEDKDKPYTIPIETPVWQERLEDYGNTNVWIDHVEITSDHEYLYIAGESNLVEGTNISLTRKDKDDDKIPFTGDTTKVNPDGTFELKEHYLSLRQGQYIQLIVDTPNSWDNVVEAYGEELKNIEGDLVQTDEGGKHYISYEVPIDVPELSPPEEVDLTMKEEEIKLKMEDTLLFDFDKSELNPDSEEVLDGVIDDLKDLASDTVVHINGHTDDEGETDYNQTLYEERAQAVLSYLKKHGDIEDLNIRSEGFGETQPIASNDEEKGRKENRRVEIVINPDGDN